ncbi:hypothetical protein LOZ03_006731, partial [Ophidiomyces ophidiicola]
RPLHPQPSGGRLRPDHRYGRPQRCRCRCSATQGCRRAETPRQRRRPHQLHGQRPALRRQPGPQRL